MMRYPVLACLLLGFLKSASPIPFNEGTQGEGSRDSNPVFNVWEYAYIHDGQINTQERLQQQQLETTTENPQSNPCLWAIVSCCSASTRHNRDNCFEELECPGAWFDDLCADEYQQAALAHVNNIFTG